MSKRVKFLGAVMTVIGLAGVTALAEGESAAGAITTAVAGLTGDAMTIIVAAVSLGAIFFGAKLLWGKFKSMAK